MKQPEAVEDRNVLIVQLAPARARPVVEHDVAESEAGIWKRNVLHLRASRIEAVRPDDLGLRVGIEPNGRPATRVVKWAIPLGNSNACGTPRRAGDVPPAKGRRGNAQIPPTGLVVGS